GRTFIAVLSELLSKKEKGEEIEKKREEETMSQLFKKGSSSANEMAEIWDDSALIRMYEESMSSAYNAVVPGSGGTKKKTKEVKKEDNGWSVGNRCAAPYKDEDGQTLWYPATITRIDSSSVEVVFDGYDGAETVAVEELYPEEDLEKGEEQKEEEGDGEEMDASSSASAATAAAFQAAAPAAAAAAAASRKRTNGGAGRREAAGGSGGQGFRAPIPTLAPPPPPSFTSLPRPNEDDALSSMLMSWYMSGYHTGYYQAMQDLKADKK
ncbi:smn-1, partial [Pristionchus pacificus]|uniref:Tudor domain-containing protein n=1 Tax=Pristionchus pacificus TaxID=54126 RepID=A0A8R1V2I6_PRIPA